MLKPRARKFIKEYVRNGGNATRAAFAAGYGDGGEYSRLAGHRLITNDNVIREIETAIDRVGLSGQFLAKRLKQIITKPKDGDGIALTGVNLAGKWKGYDTPKEKFEIPPMPKSPEEIDDIIKRMKATTANP